jgi:tRNA A-37 threonylcarbamoyl transferase component Bud32/tetratricopeptide (TPR) repeat protein
MDGQPQSQPRPREADTIADAESDPGEAKKLSTIGRYVVLDSVGMGGMGLVCAAYDPKLNRKIALKLLRNASDEEASTAGRNRLFREAQALAQLSHPNVVTVHDVDVFEGQVYIAMEFVEGMTLREWLRERPRTWKEILEKFILAGRGLAAAHEADIIHRDFKPSNVLIGKDGAVRVADFGVAKERDRPQRDAERERLDFERRRHTASLNASETTSEDALIDEIQSNISIDLTVAGRMVGTPAYMAPEQHMGLHVGPYTDQYAFCVSLYEALYGRLPFEGIDRRDQLAKMAEGKLPLAPKSGDVRSVPSWLHKLLARGLRPHPSERWPSMDALLTALERDPIKRIRRGAVLGVGLLGIGAGAFGLAWGLVPDEDVSYCPALADDIAGHWNPERRAQIEQVFLASETPYANDSFRRVAQTFDGWASTWAASRVEICEATRVGEQSADLLDVRMYCLERRANEFDAMVNLFIEADAAVVERSVSAAHDIGDPRACVGVRDTGEIADRQLDRAAREQIAEMNADLDRAFALRSADKHGESLPLQARVVERARKLPHSHTLTRALYELAESQFETGDSKGGEASLREAIELSSTLGDAQREAEIWTRLIFYLGSEQQRFREGHAWALAASAALIRAGGAPELGVRYEGTMGSLELAESHFDQAIVHYGRALELARETFGEDHPTTIRMMMNYGISLARVTRHHAQAEAVLLEAVTRSKDVYGPLHPWLATVYLNLGSHYFVAKQHDKAEVACRAALHIRERVGGADAPTLAGPLQMLAKLMLKREGFAEALVDLERVLAILSKSKGERSREVSGVLLDIATAQQGLDRFAEARATFDRVETIYAEIYADGHLHVGGLEKRRCDLFIDMELWGEAVAACERALAIDERFTSELDIELEVYELLVKAERGRGHEAAAERAQQRVVELELEIELAKARVGKKINR